MGWADTVASCSAFAPSGVALQGPGRCTLPPCLASAAPVVNRPGGKALLASQGPTTCLPPRCSSVTWVGGARVWRAGGRGTPTGPRLQMLPPSLLLLLLSGLRSGPRRAFPAGLAMAASASSCNAGGADPGLSAAFVTCPSPQVAREIARAVVEKRLAACVNVVPGITSIYQWKGQIEEDAEVLLMMKTRSSRISALAEFVRSMHPYEVAEVIAVPIQQGNPPYLQWVKETVPE
ncbi:protein CutA [Paroedura picta]|uniref:protein CutA n=1 Tax=Paroedura picta TaxID=143630 RepID=UPI0040565112